MNRDSASVTPEMQADFLEKSAHCVGIVFNPPQAVKYFIYDIAPHPMAYGLESMGFKVTYNNGKAVQIQKYTADEIKRMAACAGIKFGD